MRWSVAARAARAAGLPVKREHVSPKRALAREAIKLVEKGASDEQIVTYLARMYEVVVLSPEERAEVDRRNRSNIGPDRLAGIAMERAYTPPPCLGSSPVDKLRRGGQRDRSLVSALFLGHFRFRLQRGVSGHGAG